MKKNTKLIIGVVALVIFGILFLSFTNVIKLGAMNYNYDEPNFTRAVYGNESSTIVVKEFSDLQCPACSSANRVFIKIREEYKDKVRFEFYHYPLISIHSNAFLSAEGAECAKDQGKFWEFVDLAYENQGNLKKNGLIDMAKEIGVNTNLFEACLNSKAKEDDVMKDMALGDSLNLQGTPTFFINDKELANWGYTKFKEALNNEIAK